MVFILSFLFSALLAVADEINQGFVDGRNRSAKDVGIDCLGALSVLFTVFIILALIRYYNAHSRVKQKMNIFR
jgi:VanZ family protein